MDEALLASFRAWGVDAHDWRPRTREQYCRRVAAAHGWLAARGVDLATASTAQLAAYCSTLAATPGNRNHARQALAAFYTFLGVRESAGGNPADRLPTLRRRRSVPRPIADFEAGLVWKAARAAGGLDEPLVALCLFSGLRASEAAGLEWADVAGDWLHLVGKGGQQRVLPLHEAAAGALARWRPACPSARWVLPSPVDPDAAVSYSTVRRRIAAVGQVAGVDGLTPHRLRHTNATALLEACGDVRLVQDMLGHASPATTQIYTLVRPARLAAAVGLLDFGGE